MQTHAHTLKGCVPNVANNGIIHSITVKFTQSLSGTHTRVERSRINTASYWKTRHTHSPCSHLQHSTLHLWAIEVHAVDQKPRVWKFDLTNWKKTHTEMCSICIHTSAHRCDETELRQACMLSYRWWTNTQQLPWLLWAGIATEHTIPVGSYGKVNEKEAVEWLLECVCAHGLIRTSL